MCIIVSIINDDAKYISKLQDRFIGNDIYGYNIDYNVIAKPHFIYFSDKCAGADGDFFYCSTIDETFILSERTYKSSLRKIKELEGIKCIQIKCNLDNTNINLLWYGLLNIIQNIQKQVKKTINNNS